MIADPRAETLLGGTPMERAAFRTLALRLALPHLPVQVLADRVGLPSRQAVYRALAVAASRGFGPEVKAIAAARKPRERRDD